MSDRSLLGICTAALGLAVLLFIAACGSDLNTARKSISAAATLGAAAGTIASTLDQQKEDAISTQLAADHNVATATKARDDWHLTRTRISQALKSYDAVVVAAGATAELAGAKLDLVTLLSTLSQAYTSLTGALASYGITLPKVGL